MPNLPPDRPLLELAKAANAQLRPTAGVSFFRIQDGDHLQTGIVFEYGSCRGIVRTQNILTVHDTPEIVKSVREWSEQISGNKWTLDPEEAA